MSDDSNEPTASIVPYTWDNTGTLVPYILEEPTAHLKFIDGKLHQAFSINNGVEFPKIEWRPVPSEASDPSQ